MADALTGCGVKVLRPAAPGKDVDIRSPHWDARATPPLNVRDQTIILGNTIVETAPHVRARIFENDLLKPAFYRYYQEGANWVSMPRPALARGSLDTSYFTSQDLDVSRAMDGESAGAIEGLGLEMVFDGAQCMRLGRDVLVNVANHSHELALRWLRDNLPGLRFHRLNAMADNHIDSVLVPLRPGLMLLRSPDYREVPAQGHAVLGRDLRPRHRRQQLPRLQRPRLRHPHRQPVHGHQPAVHRREHRRRQLPLPGADRGPGAPRIHRRPRPPPPPAPVRRRLPLLHPRHRPPWRTRGLPQL
ncbi:LOW QUALITY PROTEIN: inosamine-phosphate amidinotransferase 1, partial [Streptomyces griseoflavus Tu4000]